MRQKGGAVDIPGPRADEFPATLTSFNAKGNFWLGREGMLT